MVLSNLDYKKKQKFPTPQMSISLAKGKTRQQTRIFSQGVCITLEGRQIKQGSEACVEVSQGMLFAGGCLYWIGEQV